MTFHGVMHLSLVKHEQRLKGMMVIEGSQYANVHQMAHVGKLTVWATLMEHWSQGGPFHHNLYSSNSDGNRPLDAQSGFLCRSHDSNCLVEYAQ